MNEINLMQAELRGDNTDVPIDEDDIRLASIYNLMTDAELKKLVTDRILRIPNTQKSRLRPRTR